MKPSQGLKSSPDQSKTLDRLATLVGDYSERPDPRAAKYNRRGVIASASTSLFEREK